MDEATRVRLKQKFVNAYFMIIKENMTFKKMKPLCNMEERHRVDIGTSYRNDHRCATFVESIATDLQDNLRKNVSNVKFFSLLMDGSTDCGNVDNQLFLVLYFGVC